MRYELTQGRGAWDVSFESSTTAGPSATGTTREGEASLVGLEVANANVTSAEFVLTWTDDVGAPDLFELLVTSPSGETRAGNGSAGRVRVAFERIAVHPPDIRLLGEDALRRAAEDYADAKAVGRWNVTVRLVTAGDATAPAGGLVLQADAGNAWTLTSLLTTYRAEVTAA